jgi:hypothetical protein
MYGRNYEPTLASVEIVHFPNGRAMDDAALPRLDSGAL